MIAHANGGSAPPLTARRLVHALGALLCTAAIALPVTASPSGKQRSGRAPITLVDQGSFAAGGTVLRDADGKSQACDHGYVEYQIPVRARAFPIFLWHSSSAAVFQRRWDGGEGFQNILLRSGFSTYVWDGPRVGRANYGCESYAYAPAPGRDQGNVLAWRLGSAPGKWHPGVQFPTADADAFDQAMRARYDEFDTVRNAQLESDAAAKALERIGPSVLVTNSAGGMRAMLTALKTDKVAAIIAYETPGFVYPESHRPRIAEGPYGPVYVSDAEFRKLARVPIQIVWGDNVEASQIWGPIREQSIAFARLINQYGGRAEVLSLPDAGLRGNTHIPFADLNNAEVARQMFRFLRRHKLDRR